MTARFDIWKDHVNPGCQHVSAWRAKPTPYGHLPPLSAAIQYRACVGSNGVHVYRHTTKDMISFHSNALRSESSPALRHKKSKDRAPNLLNHRKLRIPNPVLIAYSRTRKNEPIERAEFQPDESHIEARTNTEENDRADSAKELHRVVQSDIRVRESCEPLVDGYVKMESPNATR